MKKYVFFSFLTLCLFACTVDEETQTNEVQEANLSFEYETCGEQATYNFGSAGVVNTWTDDENLYVEFSANPGRSLVQSRVSLIQNILSDFPVDGTFSSRATGKSFPKPGQGKQLHLYIPPGKF
jgi:hypothetical protein